MILKMPTAIVKSQRHICATMDDLLWILIRLFHDFQNAKACRITTAVPEVTAVKGLFLCVCERQNIKSQYPFSVQPIVWAMSLFFHNFRPQLNNNVYLIGAFCSDICCAYLLLLRGWGANFTSHSIRNNLGGREGSRLASHWFSSHK